MSYYDDNDKDGLRYELEDFLEKYTVKDVLKILCDVIDVKERLTQQETKTNVIKEVLQV